MSKTADVLIEKNGNLIKGLRKYLSEGGQGITPQKIESLEEIVEALRVSSDECDNLRAQLAPKIKHTNELMAKVREAYSAYKLVIRNTFPQEKWAEYGLADKR
ncbi:MAG: hypothetical protein J5663_11920 [Bacteroidaceae bacterium]|nr:hypothetical protein [Bacteroidaceae bacterium]